MEKINLGSIQLVVFDKTNKNHLEYLKYLSNDKSIRSRFQGLLPALNKKSNELLGKGFFLEFLEDLCGYIQIGKYNENDKSVYLQAAAIDQNYRGKRITNSDNMEISLAQIMLDEISNYLFEKYPGIETIKLTIAEDNIPAQKLAQKCGYIRLDATHYGKERQYKNKFQK